MNYIKQKHHVVYKTETPLVGPDGQYISVFSRPLKFIYSEKATKF